jgi:hypothetical protein
MHRISARWLAILLALAGSPAIPASPPQHFAWPGHGELLLNVPDQWRSGLQQAPGGLPPTIWLSPRSGAPFMVQITPITETAPDKIRTMVATAARSAEPQSVERSLTLRDLVGPNGRGYYFFATDKAPAPGEWKYLTQGATRTGAIALAFTILTNDGQEADAKAALEVIRLAVHQPGDST